MNNCLAQSDFQELGKSMLQGFDRRIAAIPNDLCAPFTMEAKELETELLTIYKVVALSVRKEEDMDRIAECWGTMVQMCDESSNRILELAQRHPYCGAESYHDKILDLRNKCKRLQQMHS